VKRWYLAGDLGGTKMAAAFIEASGQIAARGERPTPAGQGMEPVAEAFAALLLDVAAQCDGLLPEACGVAAPGLVDAQAGAIRYAANLGGVRDYPLRQRLEARLGMPVTIDNDLRLHALGERALGAAVGCANFLFVAVGTGVGSALYLGGELHRGARGYAGEIGHISIDGGAQARRCTCGRRGCLEAYASGPAIAADFALRAEQAGLQHVDPLSSLKEIAAWLEQDDLRGELARAAVSAGAEALGRGLSIAANLFDPERIILGGGVANLGAVWLDGVRRAFGGLALHSYDEQAIQISRLGGDAALVGAVILAQQG
jgi:glucokinase